MRSLLSNLVGKAGRGARGRWRLTGIRLPWRAALLLAVGAVGGGAALAMASVPKEARDPAGSGAVYEAGGSNLDPPYNFNYYGNLLTLNVPAGAYAVNAVGYVFENNFSDDPTAHCQLIKNPGIGERGGNTGGFDVGSSDLAAIPVQDVFTFRRAGRIGLTCPSPLDMASNSTIQAIKIG